MSKYCAAELYGKLSSLWINPFRCSFCYWLHVRKAMLYKDDSRIVNFYVLIQTRIIICFFFFCFYILQISINVEPFNFNAYTHRYLLDALLLCTINSCRRLLSICWLHYIIMFYIYASMYVLERANEILMRATLD